MICSLLGFQSVDEKHCAETQKPKDSPNLSNFQFQLALYYTKGKGEAKPNILSQSRQVQFFILSNI
jgi:hypothetical protein